MKWNMSWNNWYCSRCSTLMLTATWTYVSRNFAWLVAALILHINPFALSAEDSNVYVRYLLNFTCINKSEKRSWRKCCAWSPCFCVPYCWWWPLAYRKCCIFIELSVMCDEQILSNCFVFIAALSALDCTFQIAIYVLSIVLVALPVVERYTCIELTVFASVLWCHKNICRMLNG